MELMTFIANNWFLFVALIVVVALIVAEPLRRKIYRVEQANPVDTVNLINRQNAVVVDVRDNNDFRNGHILGAINIPVGELVTRSQELEKYKKRPIVVSCAIGQSALKGALVFRRLGFDDVRTLAGGMAAWERSQLPVEK